jgi:hypothetical protein
MVGFRQDLQDRYDRILSSGRNLQSTQNDWKGTLELRFFAPPEADFTDPISSGNRIEKIICLILLILSKFGNSDRIHPDRSFL